MVPGVLPGLAWVLLPPGPAAVPSTAMPEGLVDRLDEVRDSWGIDFPAARAVLVALATGSPVTVAGLVAGAGLPRRRVEGILRALDRWTEADDDRLELTPPAAAGLGNWLGATAADPLPEPELVARMGTFAAGLAPSRRRLDHVPATAETMARRALFLATTYALDRAHLLCVGDHDLTSLAVATAVPGVRVTVVDLDERVLAHIDESARQAGLDIACAQADLRLGLPGSLVGSADLAFTDPPYTPAGIELFLRRSIQALRRTTPSRILFCYGFGDRGAGRAVEVQAVANSLGLAFEAIHPHFSTYHGAEAIGSRSHLYVCRPSRTSWAAAERPRHLDPRIYTRGPEAENASPPILSESALAHATAGLDDGSGAPVTLVGPGWPPAGTGPLGAARRLRLDEFLARPRPPGGPVAVNLHPGFGGALTAALLAAPPSMTLVTDSPSWRAGGFGHAGDPVGDFFSAGFTFEPGPGGGEAGETVVRVGRRTDRPADPGGALHRYLLDHGAARIANAWREGLIHVATAAGVALTKNDARLLVAGTGPGCSLERLRLGELSLHSLGRLSELTRATVTAIVGGAEAH